MTEIHETQTFIRIFCRRLITLERNRSVPEKLAMFKTIYMAAFIQAVVDKNTW